MDYGNIATAFRNKNLSASDTTADVLRTSAYAALFCNVTVLRQTLEEAETTLARVERDLKSREAKVAACIEVCENYAGATALVNASSASFDNFMAKLAAEQAAADRLRLAIGGIKRFIEWRKANPNVRG